MRNELPFAGTRENQCVNGELSRRPFYDHDIALLIALSLEICLSYNEFLKC